MSRAHLIYPFEKRTEQELEFIRKDKLNGDVITRYYQFRKCHVSKATMLNELTRLKITSEIFQKSFENATRQDLEILCTKINDIKDADDTVNQYWKIIRRLYQWMRGYHKKGDYPPEVAWIRLKKVPYARIKREDLVPMDTIMHILEFAPSIRDKALFQCKLDAGCRIGEILTAKLGEVRFNKNGAEIYCDGKTGDSQPIILTWSTSILKLWLKEHPDKNNPESPLWPRIKGGKIIQLPYTSAYQAFRKCLKRSGTKKKIWPHLLKHISCSFDSELGLPDSFRKYKHHWTEGSKMSKVYEHISPSLVPRIQKEQLTLLQKYGYETGMKPQDDEQLIPTTFSKKCSACNFVNPRDSKYCNQCATKIIEAEEKIPDKLQEIIQNPDKMKKLETILQLI